jgi:hypothetical protein
MLALRQLSIDRLFADRERLADFSAEAIRVVTQRLGNELDVDVTGRSYVCLLRRQPLGF